ncbi:beta-1,3-glucanase family protein [Paenibacillus sp. NPDC057934]|uniref:beta-1,3-glucanase family protein n=1 Tax=Paenibacillus sp. NPDC057934 TaxID=3346282 RepID=UPI0036DA765F
MFKKLFKVWLVLTLVALPLLHAKNVLAAGDYTAGVSESGSTGKIWFQTGLTLRFLDVHYTVTSGGQTGPEQNVAVLKNAATGQYEHTIPAPLTANDVIKYFFTYFNEVTGGATDTQQVSYTFGQGGGGETPISTLTSPTFNPGAGTYATAQNVAITATPADATIYYTTDGSTPTRSSALYTGTIQVPQSQTLKAIAVKNGYNDSPAAVAAYTISSNSGGSPEVPVGSNRLTVQIKNDSKGQYPDSQVYWQIVGKSYQTGKFVHVNANGQLVEMKRTDNTYYKDNHDGNHTNDYYTNYFHKLSDVNWVSIPDIESARLYVSYGEPVLIRTVDALDGAGNIVGLGYQGPDINSPTDANQNIYFDFVEFNLGPEGFHGNTTRVDQFGFPLKMQLIGHDGYNRTVGETESRAAIYAAFKNEVGPKFRSLADSQYRILAPGKGSFGHPVNGEDNTHFFDNYINNIWNTYRSQELVFAVPVGGGNLVTYSGHIMPGTDRFVFKKDNHNGSGFTPYQYYVDKPTTADALEGKGAFDRRSAGQPTSITDVELAIQAQLCAAINRGLLLNVNPANWGNESYFFQTAPSNDYVKFWHDHSIDRLAYGFCYDDVRDFSPSLHTTSPKAMVVTVAW